MEKPITKLAQALEISEQPRVITVATSPWKIVHTNKAWHDVTGYKFTEIANMTNSFLQGPDTERETERELAHALQNGRHAKVRLLNYTKAGEPFFNTLECFPLRDPNGRLTHYCGVLRGEPAGDAYARRPIPSPLLGPTPASYEPTYEPRVADEAGISRNVTVEAPYRPKRQRGQHVRLSEALNNSTDAVVMTQAHHPFAITHVNQPWCVMCGYTQEEVEGVPNSILQGPETDQAILNDLMSSVERGESKSATLVNYKKGGVRFVNQVTVTPVYNDEDELEQFMAMLHEVDGV